ncbi:MAG: allophanate hydrolase [Methylophaga sp.]|nr:MAG: allophanate hydrolase [Methylophaga sp.]
MDFSTLDMTIPSIHTAYREGSLTPDELVDHLLNRCDDYLDHAIWIRQLSKQEIQPYLERLVTSSIEDLPLYGIPFAIKDNIDLAGVPTTAACVEFSYDPAEHAHVVAELINAGAIPIGKTNLDQFATGLVGVRSPEPWGPCKNSINPDYISGGSSAGSAVAVALGLVTFSLGTDTAGSGRVPAAFNNIVGLKPSKGLLSTQGVVPACRSLDCVSIFSLTTDDANSVFDVAAHFDSADIYARANIDTNKANYGQLTHASFRFATPTVKQLNFFGNDEAKLGFEQTVKTLESLGGIHQTIDFEPFLAAARLLYEGPWVAERRVATSGVKHEHMLPVIQNILASQVDATADDLFTAQYKLQACYQQVKPVLADYDFILTPTTGTIYTREEVLADPIQLNSNLGYYTNFMNLLDCSAIAVPAGFASNGLPYGVTLFSRAFSDSRLMSYGNALQQALNIALGSTTHPLPKTTAKQAGVSDRIELLVCGAHLEGLPLNWQLTDRGGKLVKKTTTSENYRLYALAGGPPERPGIVRDETLGTSIEVEVWSLPTAQLGSFVANIPAPLGIGKVELADGSWLTGFICEPYGIDTATDITHKGGWRAHI